jgi:uncharacterized membrane protein YqjE
MPDGSEPPLGELFRQLSEDATRLTRQEVALGKAELRETGAAMARDAAKLGVAVVLALFGGMAATAFLIAGLGALLASYWLAALLVAVVFFGIAAVFGKQAFDDIRERDLKPTETMETLRADVEWAKREAQVVKQEWKS